LAAGELAANKVVNTEIAALLIELCKLCLEVIQDLCVFLVVLARFIKLLLVPPAVYRLIFETDRW
jgi:hypothetical protein